MMPVRNGVLQTYIDLLGLLQLTTYSGLRKTSRSVPMTWRPSNCYEMSARREADQAITDLHCVSRDGENANAYLARSFSSNRRSLGFAVLLPHIPFTTLTLLADLAGEAETHRDSPGKENWN